MKSKLLSHRHALMYLRNGLYVPSLDKMTVMFSIHTLLIASVGKHFMFERAWRRSMSLGSSFKHGVAGTLLNNVF